MVWYEDVTKACVDARDTKKILAVLISDESDESKRFTRGIRGKRMSFYLEESICLVIQTNSQSFIDFKNEFHCASFPQLILIDAGNVYKIIPGSLPLVYVENLLSQIFNKSIPEHQRSIDPNSSVTVTLPDPKIIPISPVTVVQQPTTPTLLTLSDKVRIKFERPDLSFWEGSFDKETLFSVIRNHVAQELQLDVSKFSLSQKIPIVQFTSESDEKSLKDLSLYPSCIICIKYINGKNEAATDVPATAHSFSISMIPGLLIDGFILICYYISGIISYFCPSVAANPTASVIHKPDLNKRTPRNSSLNSDSDGAKIRRFKNPEDGKDDDTKRKTDNGNSTQLD